MLVSIDGEKLMTLKGYKMEDGEILIVDKDTTLPDKEEVVIKIEPSLLKFWIHDRGLLDDLGLDVAIWE